MHYSQKKNRALYFFAALIAAAVCVLIFEYNGVGDSDYYWHIVLGREICQTQHPYARYILLAIRKPWPTGNGSFLARQRDSL